jgi:NADPH:quinone reductase-like Zn-dependent oxidoreductase
MPTAAQAPISGSHRAAQILVMLPDDLSDQRGAAMMLEGMTAQVLVRQISRAREGDTVLFHAASSGVGLIACQWLKYLGVAIGNSRSRLVNRLLRLDKRNDIASWIRDFKSAVHVGTALKI